MKHIISIRKLNCLATQILRGNANSKMGLSIQENVLKAVDNKISAISLDDSISQEYDLLKMIKRARIIQSNAKERT